MKPRLSAASFQALTPTTQICSWEYFYLRGRNKEDNNATGKAAPQPAPLPTGRLAAGREGWSKSSWKPFPWPQKARRWRGEAQRYQGQTVPHRSACCLWPNDWLGRWVDSSWHWLPWHWQGFWCSLPMTGYIGGKQLTGTEAQRAGRPSTPEMVKPQQALSNLIYLCG